MTIWLKRVINYSFFIKKICLKVNQIFLNKKQNMTELNVNTYTNIFHSLFRCIKEEKYEKTDSWAYMIDIFSFCKEYLNIKEEDIKNQKQDIISVLLTIANQTHPLTEEEIINGKIKEVIYYKKLFELWIENIKENIYNEPKIFIKPILSNFQNLPSNYSKTIFKNKNLKDFFLK